MYNLLSKKDHVHTYFGGSEDLALETLKSFVEQSDEEFKKIDAFLASEDPEISDIFVVLHSLKPVIFYLGLQQSYEKLEASVEKIRGSHDLAKAKPLIGEVSLMLKNDVKEMRTYLSELTAD